MAKAYRMVTPINADPATLRWVAEHADALAEDNEQWAWDTAGSPGEPLYNDRASKARTFARSMRARASRIEAKQKRGRRG